MSGWGNRIYSKLFGAGAKPTPSKSSNVFFDVTQDAKHIGTMEFTLYDNECPKTCQNFRLLCTGQNEGRYTYRKSIFHRIIPGFMAQGGDFTHHNGMGGRSIYGAKFPDENLTLKHNKRGLLVQFYTFPN
jgi:peptidylprolyl isomerase